MNYTAVVVCLLVGVVLSQSQTPIGKSWHKVPLDSDGKAIFEWSTDHKSAIQFRLTYKATGWATVGFSLSGSMKGADIFLIYVTPTGSLVSNDCYATANTMPIIDDAASNYDVNSSVFNGTHITVEASRPYNTCDDQDVPITNDTIRLLWAMDDTPVNNFNQMNKHKTLNRGSRSIQLMYPQNARALEKLLLDPELGTIDVTVTNAPIPSAHHTLYYCQIIEVPKRTTPAQLVGFDAVIEPRENIKFVHHLILYKCKSRAKAHAGRAGPCYSQKPYETTVVDPLMKTVMEECTQQLVAGWAYGGEGYAFPEDTGLPLFESDDSTVLMLEMHYDNQDFVPNKIDNSGLRLYHTPIKRPREAVHMLFGLATSPKDVIVPPGSIFTAYSYCPADCTNLMDGGIEIFAGLLHTHLIGVKVRLRHIRNGVELPPIQADENYDFNYQNVASMKEPVVVLPGDEMVLECVYDSTSKQNTTLGGEATTNEMCIALMYGVAMGERKDNVDGTKDSFVVCMTSADMLEPFKTGGFTFDTLEIVDFALKDDRSYDIVYEMFDNPGVNQTSTLDEFMYTHMQGKWDEKVRGVTRRETLQRVAKHGDQMAICALQGGGFENAEFVKVYGPPTVDVPYKTIDTCKANSYRDNKTKRDRKTKAGRFSDSKRDEPEEEDGDDDEDEEESNTASTYPSSMTSFIAAVLCATVFK